MKKISKKLNLKKEILSFLINQEVKMATEGNSRCRDCAPETN